MTDHWNVFLDQQGARRDGDGLLLGFAETSPTPAVPLLAVMAQSQVLALRGADAATFLQGQVTADVRLLGEQRPLPTMHLSLKGRGLFSARLLPAADGGIDLLLPTAQSADDAKRMLGKYMVFSKATLTDDPRVVLMLVDDTPDTLEHSLHQARLPQPLPDHVVVEGDITVARLDGRRTLVILPAEAAMERWPMLVEARTPCADDGARLASIVAGDGELLPGAEDMFLPQALNFDVSEGVSFRKGCYTGQEIVARMHFKGEMKQRMQRYRWPDATRLPAPGAVVRSDAGRALGEVVMAVAADDAVEALVVVRLSHDGDLHLEPWGALQATSQPLPYPLPEK